MEIDYEVENFVKPLYVSRLLTEQSANDVLSWYRAQGVPNLKSVVDLHCTIAYSKEAVDWDSIIPDHYGFVTHLYDAEHALFGTRSEENNNMLLVLKLTGQKCHRRLEDAWKYYMKKGCSYDFPDYIPHITIADVPDDSRWKNIMPYEGRIEFEAEIMEELDEDRSAV